MGFGNLIFKVKISWVLKDDFLGITPWVLEV